MTESDVPDFRQGWAKEEISHAIASAQADFTVDEALVEVLPRGTRILSAYAYGTSAWTVTARLSTVQPDGQQKRYFLKCAQGDHGRTMILGEYTSVNEILKFVPGLLPEPYAWGVFKSGHPRTYFFPSHFVDMDVVSAPEPAPFAAKVAELHQASASPDGRFGFHVTTCDGKMAHTVDWDTDWAKFFTGLLHGVFKLDTETNGSLPKLEAAMNNVVERVIPRLLDSLQGEERELKASVIHSDLWEGNVGTRLTTGEIILFDAGSY